MSDKDEPPDPSSFAESLRRVFPDLHDDLLSEMTAQLSWRHFPAGAVVFRQGEAADALYIITSGQASIETHTQPAPTTVAVLGPGEFFGEMALFAGTPRSATVSARTELEVLKLGLDQFQRVVVEGSARAQPTPTVTSAGTAAPKTPDHQRDWTAAIRAACHAMVASQNAVHSVDVVSRPVTNDDPAGLLRLVDLARRTATEYGVEVRGRQTGPRLVLRLSTSPRD